MREVVGYIKGTCESSIKVQKRMLIKFADQTHLDISRFFCDRNPRKRCIEDVEKAQKLGLSGCYRQEQMFPAWESMLAQILNGNIAMILVDSKIRLAVSQKAFSYLMKVCEDLGVQICEVKFASFQEGTIPEPEAIVYHFTNSVFKRSCVVGKDVDRIYGWAYDHQVDIQGLYLDFTLKESEKKQKSCMLEEVEKYKVLLLMDFYHLEVKTDMFIRQVKELWRKGVEVVGIRDGRIKDMNSSLLKKEMKVAVYMDDNIQKSNGRQEILDKIFYAFVKYKTNWTIIHVYKNKINGEMHKSSEFINLVEDNGKFDAVIVDSMSTIAYRTAKFIHRMKELNRPVFSLKEGGVIL